MLLIFISLVPLLAAAAGRPHHMVDSAILERQSPNSGSSPECNVRCDPGAFPEIGTGDCHAAPNCECSTRYLQAQGECLLCYTSTPKDAALVQLALDEEINECHKSGVPIQFRLQLPPDAQAIVDQFHRDSARLRRQQTAFFALQITGGHVGLAILLAFSIFSRRFSRDPTFLNFCITWIFSSAVYSLLLYRGTRGNTVVNPIDQVSPAICVSQASLINGVQIMTASSTMALVIQLWIGLRVAIHGDLSYGPKQRQWTTITFLVLPYVLFFAFAIPSIFVGKVHVTIAATSQLRVLPANFYCSIIQLQSFLRAIYGVTLGILTVTTVFDVLIIVILYRHWWTLRHVQIKNGVSLSMLLRVIVFSIYRIVVAVAYGTILDTPPQLKFLRNAEGDPLVASSSVPVWVDLLQASVPLVGFFILGINGDLLTSLMFWRRDRKYVPGNV